MNLFVNESESVFLQCNQDNPLISHLGLQFINESTIQNKIQFSKLLKMRISTETLLMDTKVSELKKFVRFKLYTENSPGSKIPEHSSDEEDDSDEDEEDQGDKKDLSMDCVSNSEQKQESDFQNQNVPVSDIESFDVELEEEDDEMEDEEEFSSIFQFYHPFWSKTEGNIIIDSLIEFLKLMSDDALIKVYFDHYDDFNPPDFLSFVCSDMILHIKTIHLGRTEFFKADFPYKHYLYKPNFSDRIRSKTFQKYGSEYRPLLHDFEIEEFIHKIKKCSKKEPFGEYTNTVLDLYLPEFVRYKYEYVEQRKDGRIFKWILIENEDQECILIPNIQCTF